MATENLCFSPYEIPRGKRMRVRYISAILLLLLVCGEVGTVHGQDAAPEIIGDCRLELELKPGQGCTIPGGGSFSIRTDGCALVTSSTGGVFSTSEVSMNVSARCELGNGRYVASRISSDSLTWRVDSLPSGQEIEIIGDCRVGLELKPGQGCAVPDAGSFSIRADGCVGDTPSVSGEGSMSDISISAGSFCVKGKWGKGEFGASRISSDPLKWRIDSLPPGLAN